MGDSLNLNSGGYIIVCKGAVHKSDRKSVIAVVVTPTTSINVYIYVALTQKYNDLIWS